MPEQEIKEKTGNKRLMLSILALFVLLVLILAGKSFFSTEIKEVKEAEFNYAPVYKQGSPELEISALSYLGAYLVKDNQPIILAEKNSDDLLPMASITSPYVKHLAYQENSGAVDY